MSGGFRSRSKSGDNSEARTPQGGKKPQSKPSGERVKYDRHERTGGSRAGGSRTGGSRAGRAGGTNRNRERSEERRVGKEGMGRVAAGPGKDSRTVGERGGRGG